VGIVVTDLSFDRIGAAARLLARGFHADPIITFYLDDPAARRVALPAFFRAVIYETFEAGHAYAALAGERLLGVAVWLPPSGAAPSPAFRRRASRNHAVVRARFPRGAGGLYAGFGATESLHPQEPHWYLAFIGVDPAAQRSGVGSQLLSPVLAQADAAGRLCYLETPFPETHQFYRRHGFELGKAARPFQGAPGLWTMLRNPASPTESTPEES
jgi:GNAT superfamily N-acetyltransferase